MAELVINLGSIVLVLERYDLQLDKVESMRIRAILTYYYEETYPGLEEEIQKALLKDSKTYTLQRLLQLIHFRK
jgi:hypothetical protein